MAFIRNVDKLIEGLENKFFTEARAKAALAPELAAEESARLAGDAAEAAARQAADNSLDARLDVIEGSGEGSVAKAEQDAKDYADQKVAALVNSAPAVLDTLKELSDALGGDENFATTVAGQIGVVDAKVEQEILDRQSAVSAEQSARESADQALDGRLDVLEADPTTKSYVDGEVSDLQGQITQEISDRQQAISDEEDARELADSNLSSRISVLEQDPVTKAYVDGEVSDLQGQITQEISDRQSDVDAEESRALAAEGLLSGRIDVLEQDPTTKSYVDQEIGSEESRAMQAEQALDGRLDILEQDPTTKTYVDGKVLMLQGEVDSEESRAMAAEGALDGRLDVLEQDPTTKAYVDEEVLDLQQQISQEVSARQSEVSNEASVRQLADNALDGRLDILEQDPTTKSYVDQEVQDLQGQITQEISDRQSDVNAEESRAMAAESALDGRLDVLEADPVTKSYVDGEVSNLQGQVSTEKGRIDAILSASQADKDSFAEIVQLINSVDTANDNAFASYVLSNNAALAQEVSDRQSDVNAEESRALAAEGLLDGRLDVLEADPVTKSYVNAADALRLKLDGSNSMTGQLNIDLPANSQMALRATSVPTLNGIIGAMNFQPYNGTGYTSSVKLSGIATEGHTSSARGSKLNIEATANGSTSRTVVASFAGNRVDMFQNLYVNNVLIPDTTYVDSQVSAEASARSAEDLTLFKKDGSRNLEGNFLFSAETFNIGNSTANRPNQINVKSNILLGYSNASPAAQTTSYGSMSGTGLNLTNFTGNPSIVLGRYGYNPTTSTYSALAAETIMGVISFGGGLSTNSVASPIVSIAGVSNEALSTTNRGSKLRFSVIPNGTSSFQTPMEIVGNEVRMLRGQKVAYSTKAVDYTIVESDYIIAVSDLSVSRVMTLPSASVMGAGKVFIIKEQSGAASQSKYIQILPQSGQQIDGQSDYKVVMPYESVMLVSNGTHWFII